MSLLAEGGQSGGSFQAAVREGNKRSPATLNRVAGLAFGEAMAIAFAGKALEGKEPPRERTAEVDRSSCELIKWLESRRLSRS